MGPTFLRFKDFESKVEQHRPMRDYGILRQWLNLSDAEKEKYRV